jgi:hypothetical protein
VVSQISQRINNDEILISSNSNGVSTNAGNIATNTDKLKNLVVDSNYNVKLVNSTANKSVILTTTDSNNTANNVVTVTGDKKVGINTVSPSAGLDVNSDFYCTGGWLQGIKMRLVPDAGAWKFVVSATGDVSCNNLTVLSIASNSTVTGGDISGTTVTANGVELSVLGGSVTALQSEMGVIWGVLNNLGLMTGSWVIGSTIAGVAGIGTLASTYVPLSAGSTKKLTGDLYIGSSSGASGKNLIVYGSGTGPQVQIGDGSAATNGYTLQIGQYSMTGTQMNNLLTNTAGYITSANAITTGGGQTMTGTLTLSDTTYGNTRLNVYFAPQSGAGVSSQDYIQIATGSNGWGGAVGGGLTQGGGAATSGGFITLNAVNNPNVTTEILRGYKEYIQVNVPIALNYTTTPASTQLGYSSSVSGNALSASMTSTTTFYNVLQQTQNVTTNVGAQIALTAGVWLLTGTYDFVPTAACNVTVAFGLNVNDGTAGAIDTDKLGYALVNCSTLEVAGSITKVVSTTTAKNYTIWAKPSVASVCSINTSNCKIQATRIG